MFRSVRFFVAAFLAMMLAACAAPMQQSVPVYTPSSQMQQPVYTPASQVQQVAPQQGSITGVFCNIDGRITKEVSNAACDAKAKAKAETLVGSKVNVTSTDKPNICAAGKTWTKLNWPGHPQHEGFVCLPDGDPHRF